jgi:hypothetical protein
LLLLSPNEIEDLLLAYGEFSHRCSAEHCTLADTARKERVTCTPENKGNHRTEDTETDRVTADRSPHGNVKVFLSPLRKFDLQVHRSLLTSVSSVRLPVLPLIPTASFLCRTLYVATGIYRPDYAGYA